MLKQDVWYKIHTAINNREALFQLRPALSLFGRVLAEAKQRFVFEITGLHLVDDLLTFYIKPADGLELPDILKWMKQTFAVRYNLLAGRTGHIWGDRYKSLILEGEPPADAGWETGEEMDVGPGARTGAGAGVSGVRPQSVEMVIMTRFPPIFPRLIPPPL
jgi:hypothetical protein